MRLRRFVGLLAASWALSGCASRTQNARAPDVGAQGLRVYTPPAPPTAEETLAELGRLRGFPPGLALDVATLDDAAFQTAFDRAFPSQSVRGSDALYKTLTMAAASSDVSGKAREVYAANLVGFYDQHTKRMYVRRQATPDGNDRLTLAHEEEHALQDRFFGMPEFTAIRNADEYLATKALFEGDATVSSMELEATRTGGSAAEVVGRLARLTEAQSAVLRSAGIELAAVPPLVRAELVWPYTQGAQFVALLEANGGSSLVNAALRNPPKTTEQVLHPEKYVAGEGAIEVRPPVAPAGYTLTSVGTMGELRTQFLLAQCVDDEAARAASMGWGGDTFATAQRGDEQAFLWSTAWDDEASATRFARTLEARHTCARTGAKPDFTVQQSGTRVALVQGFTGNDVRREEAKKLFALVGSRPPALPPVGPIVLRPPPPLPSDLARGGTVEGGKFVAASLGLTADLTNLTPNKADDLELSAHGPFVGVNIAVAWSPPTPALLESAVAAFAHGFQTRAKSQGPLYDEGETRVPLSWTSAAARRLRAGKLEVRITAAPACEGKMTLLLLEWWQRATVGESIADQWRRSLQVSASAPACRALIEAAPR